MLTTFRKPGRWLRVNVHTHTTNSDGCYTPEQAVARYRDELGYQALFLTDHRVATPTDGLADPDSDFSVIPGIEIDGTDPAFGLYHLLALGITVDQNFGTDLPLQEAVDWVNAHSGLPIFAHPYWSGQRHEALTTVVGALGVEVYNDVSLKHNGKAYALSHWDALLEEGLRVWGFASDDVHFLASFGFGGGGWIMVRAEENTPSAILTAIRAGDFYASTGPDFIDVQREGDVLRVQCSPVAQVAFTGQSYLGEILRPTGGAETLTEAEFTIGDERFIRITLTTADGHSAWGQPIFLNGWTDAV